MPFKTIAVIVQNFEAHGVHAFHVCNSKLEKLPLIMGNIITGYPIFLQQQTWNGKTPVPDK